MRKFAIANQKGGSGKTTTSVNLAAALGELERRVLVIDLDPQHSATAWLGFRDSGKGLYGLFVDNGDFREIIKPTGVPGVDLAPSSAWLVGVERILAGEVGAEQILRHNLAKLPAGAWDYILMDCPPTLGILTINALAAAEELLVPVEAHVMALSGLAQLLHTVGVVRARINADLRVSGILACRVDSRTRHAREVVEQLREHHGDLVYETVIRENIRLAECPSFAQPITQYDPKSSGAADYRALAREIIAQEKNR
jgi:chromosome partitioning protein|uniref:ParA family protein n=1 Tax=Desulfobacca acetoxidans TaxID=60893 RepID=A0A7C3WIE6_9BACT